MFKNIYLSLKRGYRQSWLKFLFRYTSLAKLIAQPQEPSAFEFFNTYLSSWWWNQRWFKSCIESSEVKYQFDSILKSLQHLKEKGIFTEDNCLAVANHANPNSLAYGLSYLQQVGILTEEHRMLVANHAKPGDSACALFCLQRAGILTEEHRTLVVNHDNPDDLAYALIVLQEAGILTEENRALVANHAKPYHLYRALSFLRRAGILTATNFRLVANHAKPDDLDRAFSSLVYVKILTQANFALITNHANPRDLAYALSYLQVTGFFTEANRTLVVNHANPDDLADALSKLERDGMLTQRNFNLVANHADPYYLMRVHSYLAYSRDSNITQANFALLAAPNHAALVSQEAHQLIWSRIPAYLLTQADFYRLVTASEEDNPMIALQGALNEILGVRVRMRVQVQVQAGHAAVFNPGQSTHTASVHRSVSASASRLMASYGESLNLEAKIKEIKAYVMGLGNSPKHDATKRCIARMTRADYTFTDSSNVSTRQLLALAWEAIHDRAKCHASVEDAKALFIEGLYEIQRGYNLDDLGNDLGGEDGPICSAGTFNKLMEKLNGIHSSVEVYYITHEGLGIKFPKVVAEHALNYLNRLSNPETATAYSSMKELLDSIKENGLGPIWDNIKSAVEKTLWDEFKEAYGENPEHHKFKEMIDNGHESNAPDLTELYNTLKASPGYRAFEESNRCLGLHQHGLWATHRENPEDQNVADGQCSLVPKSYTHDLSKCLIF